MQENSPLANPNYDPNRFIDWLIHTVFKVKNDAALSRTLEVSPPVISKIRTRKLPVGPSILVKVHDLTDMPVREIRKHMGISELG